MASERTRVSLAVYVALDGAGNYGVGTDQEDAVNNIDGGSGADAGEPIRVVCLNVWMTPPETDEVNVNVSDEAGKTLAVEGEGTTQE